MRIKHRIKPSAFAMVCIFVVIISNMIAPTHSKYMLEGSGKLLHSVITGPKLTVTFKNGEEIVNTVMVDYNEEILISHERPDNIVSPEPDAEWQGWVNALGVSVPATVKITKNVVFNAKWKLKNYYVRYLDLDGNIVHEEQIDKETLTIDLDDNDRLKLAELLASMENSLNTAEMSGYGLTFSLKWKEVNIPDPIADVYVTTDVSFSADESADANIKLAPWVDSNGNIVDENGDGHPDGFVVFGAAFDDDNLDISIPEEIAGIPVVAIADNTFAGFDNLHVVRIPKSITAIGADAFSNAKVGLFERGETIAIYFEGSYEEWNAITKASEWDTGLSASTNIFFLNGGDKVDSSQGYIKRTTNLLGVPKGWEHVKEFDKDSFYSVYTADCNCGIDGCNGNQRPDAKYWPAR